MKIINQQLLNQLSDEARSNPRLRKNFNIHPKDSFPAHRLLNAIEPDSYIRPHRHLDPMKDETFIILKGKLGIIVFDEDGGVSEKILLDAKGDNVGVDLPSGVFHAAISLEEGTVFFEAKAGPYLPLTDEEQPSWAPENGAAAAEYLAELKRLF
ncbi:MAG: WbuC family cupin fold metalloprotein [Geobacteraceae bacterium]|nr:WbuC family cupin fold metalloprotein [Geobacteraceae bacterium]